MYASALPADKDVNSRINYRSVLVIAYVPTHVAEIQHNLFQNSLKQFLEFRYCITEDIEGGEMTVPFATRCKQ